MTSNTGNYDRLLRLALMAVVLFGGFALFDAALGKYGAVVMGAGPVVGLLLMATAMMRLCALYPLFGTRTCRP